MEVVIFLPVRNGGEYLSQAVDSIRAQSLDSWRLIVLENASTDDTIDRISQYDDDRITISSAETPLDIYDNWQRALPLVAELNPETLITFIGHDDLLDPAFVSTIVELRNEHPDATVYQTHFDLIDEDNGLVRSCRPIPQRETSADLAAQLCWGLRDSFGTGYAFRARDHLRVGGWPDLPKLLFADHLMFIRLTTLGYKVASPATRCSYRLHSGSTSGGMSAAKFTASLHALDRFVSALDIDLPAFVAHQQGRNAIAHLLAYELGQYHLLPAVYVLDASAHAALARLDRRFAQTRRDLPATAWTHVHPHRVPPIVEKTLYLLRSLKFAMAIRNRRG